MTERNNGTETIEPKTYAASLAQASGSWLMSNGTGEFIALTATNPVAGLLMETIASTDPNFASEKLVSVDLVTSTTDRFTMDVSAGTATSEMEGLFFDVGSNPGSLDVSAPGTQFQVTRFISATQVEVRVSKFAADLT
jgi:hypothetical protein